MAAPEEPPKTSMVPLRIGGRIERAHIGRLCERVGGLLDDVDCDVVCDVGMVEADAVAVDALARLQLTAARRGHRILLLHATPELRDLIALIGLCDVLRESPELGLEPRRQPEQREEPGGVEEERDPAEPPV